MDKQKEYDLFMVNVREMLYSEYGVQGALQQISSAEQGPARGIAYTAAMAIKSIKGGFEQKGKKVSPDVLKTAFMELVADLTELAISAGLVESGQKKQVAGQALKEGAAIYQQAIKIPVGEQQPQQPQGLVQNQMEAA